MEVKRINDDTIRVILGSEDLQKRGITVLDLLGDRRHIEDFFYKLLDEVDTVHQFAHDRSVTFQVLPSQDGLEILITRTPKNGDSNDKTNSGGSPDLLHALDYMKNDKSNTMNSSNDKTNAYDLSDPSKKTLLVKFNKFNDYVNLCNELNLSNITSDLYKYEGSYYLRLTIFVDELAGLTIADIEAVVNEYGTIVNESPELISEAGQKIMGQTAVELTKYYFK